MIPIRFQLSHGLKHQSIQSLCRYSFRVATTYEASEKKTNTSFAVHVMSLADITTFLRHLRGCSGSCSTCKVDVRGPRGTGWNARNVKSMQSGLENSRPLFRGEGTWDQNQKSLASDAHSDFFEVESHGIVRQCD